MWEKQNKKRSRLRAAILVMFLYLCIIVMPVNAKENTDMQSMAETEEASIQGSLMIAVESTEGRKAPMKNAQAIMDIPEGAFLLVTGEEENGWCEIFYQGQAMYVPAEKIEATEIAENTALEQELQKAGEEDAAFIESLEQQRKAIERSKIWRWIIIGLIAAIFIIGVLSALREAKKNTGDEKNR